LEESAVALEDAFSAQNLAFDALVARRNSEYQNLREGGLLELGILSREHAEQLKELKNTASVYLAGLEAQRDHELQVMNLDAQVAVEGISRETDNARETYELMATKLESARLARSDELVDVQMGVPAVRPEEPQPKQSMIWAATGLIAGLMAVLAMVIFLEIVLPLLQSSQEPSSETSVAYSVPVAASATDRESRRELSHQLIKN